MLNINTKQDFELRYLSKYFFDNIFPSMKDRALMKEGRPYCALLVKIKGLDFAIPLRSRLPNRDGIGIKTIPNPEEKEFFKGIDFSAAILIKDKKLFLKEDIVKLKDRSELFFIQANGRNIQREFKKYVEGYVNTIKNGNALNDKYKFSTLIYYHKELKL